MGGRKRRRRRDPHAVNAAPPRHRRGTRAVHIDGEEWRWRTNGVHVHIFSPSGSRSSVHCRDLGLDTRWSEKYDSAVYVVTPANVKEYIDNRLVRYTSPTLASMYYGFVLAAGDHVIPATVATLGNVTDVAGFLVGWRLGVGVLADWTFSSRGVER